MKVLTLISLISISFASVVQAADTSSSDQLKITAGSTYGTTLTTLATAATTASQAQVNETRSALFKKEFTQQLIDRLFNAKLPPAIAKPLEPIDFSSVKAGDAICEPRAAHAEKMLKYHYIQSAGEAIQNESKITPPSGFFEAVFEFFVPEESGGRIKVPNVTKQADQVAKKVEDACETDLKMSFLAYYHYDPDKLNVRTDARMAFDTKTFEIFKGLNPPDFSFLGPYGVAANVFIALATPIIEGIDTAKQIATKIDAIKEFIKNQPDVEKDAEAIAIELRSDADKARLRAAGELYESYVDLVSTKMPDAAKGVACSNFLSDQKIATFDLKEPAPKGFISQNFVMCWSEAFTPFKTKLDKFLLDGEQYDKLADLGTDTSPDLKKISAQVTDILNGKPAISGTDLINLQNNFLSYISSAAKTMSDTKFSQAIQAFK